MTTNDNAGIATIDNGITNDGAARAFTKHFYMSLSMGKMVKEAFEDGCKGVLVEYPKEE